MAHVLENTPRAENNYENEGKHENADPVVVNNNINVNTDPLRQFIIEYQLQQIEQPLLSSGLSINILLSLTETQIDEVSQELTQSAIQRAKFKYSVKQIQQKQQVKSNNNQNQKNDNKITHKFMDEFEEKIYVFTMVTAINDRDKARKILEDNNWDLHASVAKQFGITPGNNIMDDQFDQKTPIQRTENTKTEITLILSDNRQFKYTMEHDDTFWAIYANLLQSAPDLAARLFNLQLPNGHILKENEFDQTMKETKLIPKAVINIKIRNDNNYKRHDAKAVVNMIIKHPMNKQYTFTVNTADTFWMLYGLLLQSLPELSSKVLIMQLSNGHILKEYEFDKTVYDLKLVPKGDITVKFGDQYNKHNNYNNKSHNKQHQYNKYNNIPQPSYNHYSSIPSVSNIPSYSNMNNEYNQMQNMMDEERKKREKFEKEMEERRRRQEKEQKDRERKQKEREKKRKQEFIKAVRRGLPHIGPRQNQCAKCGRGFGGSSDGNKQRWEHQKTCTYSWNCGICGRQFDRYGQHQSHVRSCSNVKLMY